ncbi:hypothetical protein IFM89_015752 [Coptis chinensis]|uniref:Uncharacterized protein n=1 Tax=Coptis chinensis TaxID=261450 RepID=A0A835I2N6_9MAGN|nr:hypothetical protein IFM89_015752 [Coptis chinensis]
MGVCASSQASKEGGGISRPSTVKIIHADGRVQEFKQSIRAINILSQNPNSFLCSLESINLDSQMPRLAETEELQPDQIYFLLPLSQSHTHLSISDLCTLAIKASKALSKLEATSFPNGHGVKLRPSLGGGSKIPARTDRIQMSSQLGRGNR